MTDAQFNALMEALILHGEQNVKYASDLSFDLTTIIILLTCILLSAAWKR